MRNQIKDRLRIAFDHEVKSDNPIQERIEIAVSADEVRRAIEFVIAEASEEVRLPGFRRGRAPNRMVKSALDEIAVLGRTRDMIVSSVQEQLKDEIQQRSELPATWDTPDLEEHERYECSCEYVTSVSPPNPNADIEAIKSDFRKSGGGKAAAPGGSPHSSGAMLRQSAPGAFPPSLGGQNGPSGDGTTGGNVECIFSSLIPQEVRGNVNVGLPQFGPKSAPNPQSAAPRDLERPAAKPSESLAGERDRILAEQAPMPVKPEEGVQVSSAEQFERPEEKIHRDLDASLPKGADKHPENQSTSGQQELGEIIGGVDSEAMQEPGKGRLFERIEDIHPNGEFDDNDEEAIAKDGE